METVAFCEIEEYPRSILKKHWPNVPIFKDIMNLSGDIYGNLLYIENNGDVLYLDTGDNMGAKKSNRYDEAVNIYAKGMSIGDCAEYYGITRQAMHKILQRRNCSLRANNRGQKSKFANQTKNIFIDVDKLDQDFVDTVCKRYLSGSSIADCSGKYGIGTHVVDKILTHRKIKKRGAGKSGENNAFYRGGSVTGGSEARSLSYAAIRNGVLVRQSCEVCGAFGVINGRNIVHAHHDDYNRPLNVRWLCGEHHYEWHKNNKAKARRTAGKPKAIELICGGFPCQ